MDLYAYEMERKAERAYNSLHFAFVLFILQLACYIALSGLYEGGFSDDVALTYLIISLGCFVFASAYRLELKELRLSKVAVNWTVGFMITWMVVLYLYGEVWGIRFGEVRRPAVLGILVTQIVFVAASEEFMFRSLIPGYLFKMWGEGRFTTLIVFAISQGLFALFHFSAYGGNWDAMKIAFIIGCIWLFLARLEHVEVPFIGRQRVPLGPLGIGFTMGSHAAYNLMMTGLLAGNVVSICGGV